MSFIKNLFGRSKTEETPKKYSTKIKPAIRGAGDWPAEKDPYVSYYLLQDAYKNPIVSGALKSAAYAVWGQGFYFEERTESGVQRLEEYDPIYEWADDINLEDHGYNATLGALWYGDWYWEVINKDLYMIQDVPPFNIDIITEQSPYIPSQYKDRSKTGDNSWVANEEMIGFHWEPLNKPPHGTSLLYSVVASGLLKKSNDAVQIGYDTHKFYQNPILVVMPQKDQRLDNSTLGTILDNFADQISKKKRILGSTHPIQIEILGAERKIPDFTTYIDDVNLKMAAGLSTSWVVLGKGEKSTEASGKVIIGVYNYFLRRVQRWFANRINDTILRKIGEKDNRNLKFRFPELVQPVFKPSFEEGGQTAQGATGVLPRQESAPKKTEERAVAQPSGK
jgi:hypothetical protein